jgi:HAD superfamily hydrolase (TIGR01509 family)
MLKALIFDFDGLILDTETPEYLAWQDVYRRYGAELTISVWGQIVGGLHGSTFEPAGHLQELIGRDLDCDAIRAEVSRRSLETIHASPIRAGVESVIHSARRSGLTLAIASSSPHRWVDTHLKRLGLYDYFDHVLCGDDVERTKPAPDLYLLALERLRVSANAALVFEDSPNGAKAARAAKIECVVVKNPCTEHLPFEAGDHFLSSLEDFDLAKWIADG